MDFYVNWVINKEEYSDLMSPVNRLFAGGNPYTQSLRVYSEKMKKSLGIGSDDTQSLETFFKEVVGPLAAITEGSHLEVIKKIGDEFDVNVSQQETNREIRNMLNDAKKEVDELIPIISNSIDFIRGFIDNKIEPFFRSQGDSILTYAALAYSKSGNEIVKSKRYPEVKRTISELYGREAVQELDNFTFSSETDIKFIKKANDACANNMRYVYGAFSENFGKSGLSLAAIQKLLASGSKSELRDLLLSPDKGGIVKTIASCYGAIQRIGGFLGEISTVSGLNKLIEALGNYVEVNGSKVKALTKHADGFDVQIINASKTGEKADAHFKVGTKDFSISFNILPNGKTKSKLNFSMPTELGFSLKKTVKRGNKKSPIRLKNTSLGNLLSDSGISQNLRNAFYNFFLSPDLSRRASVLGSKYSGDDGVSDFELDVGFESTYSPLLGQAFVPAIAGSLTPENITTFFMLNDSVYSIYDIIEFLASAKENGSRAPILMSTSGKRYGSHALNGDLIRNKMRDTHVARYKKFKATNKEKRSASILKTAGAIPISVQWDISIEFLKQVNIHKRA